MEEERYRFLEYLQDEKGCAENTIAAYRVDLQQLIQVLNVHSKSQDATGTISPEALSHYISWLRRQGYKPATVARKMAAVRSFLGYLQSQEGHNTIVLMDRIQPPPSPRLRPKVLTESEINRLLDTASKVDTPRAKRDFAVLSLLYATGMRPAAVIDLKMQDVDLDAGVVKVPPDRKQLKPLGAAEQALKDYARTSRPHLMRSPDTQALFLNQRGNHLSRQGLWLIVKRWAKRAGLGDDVSPKTIRHSLTRHLLDRGWSRREVQDYLGLTSPNAIWIHRRKSIEGRVE